jgi:hypothetical protein
LKDHVEDLQDSLKTIEQLQGVSFVWKNSGEASVGLIAEDVVKVLPEVVQLDEKTGQPEGVLPCAGRGANRGGKGATS